MISGGQLLGFTVTSLVLIVTPGPGVLFVVGWPGARVAGCPGGHRS